LIVVAFGIVVIVSDRIQAEGSAISRRNSARSFRRETTMRHTRRKDVEPHHFPDKLPDEHFYVLKGRYVGQCDSK